MGPVQTAVRNSLHPSQVLRTPSQAAPFTVSRIDEVGVVLLLGSGEWATRLTWDCLEAIVPFLKQHGGSVRIGGRHDVDGNPGTLDEHLKRCTKRTTAGWVASMLDEAGVLRILRGRPARVELVGEP